VGFFSCFVFSKFIFKYLLLSVGLWHLLKILTEVEILVIKRSKKCMAKFEIIKAEMPPSIISRKKSSLWDVGGQRKVS